MLKFNCASVSNDYIDIGIIKRDDTGESVIIINASMKNEGDTHSEAKITTTHLSMSDAPKFAREILDLCADELLGVGDDK